MSERDLAKEMFLRALYADEIADAASWLFRKNMAEVRAIAVEVILLSEGKIAKDEASEAGQEISQILYTVGPRHLQFVLGAAILAAK